MIGNEIVEDDLVGTFNRLLEQVNQTMLIRKNFVQYVSHEFRTPLASVLGNLEVFLLKERNADEYRLLAESLITQIGQLKEVLKALIHLSDMAGITDIQEPIRFDEVLCGANPWGKNKKELRFKS